ncbi:MAG: SDR family NAD(P)-dependent oxidoreductase, partial [Pseudomonadota bacterium]
MTGFQSIVLTGASGGIGHALASRLAADGRHLLLVGRDPDRLAEAREAAAAKGAAVETAPLDVTETARLAEALLAFDDRRPVDLVIAGAGISSGTKPDGAPEGLDALRRVIEVNLLGAAATIEPLIPRMVARGHGRIVVIGSVAAHRPLPDMPAYSASKAALRAWATAIRGRLAPQGVGVTIV